MKNEELIRRIEDLSNKNKFISTIRLLTEYNMTPQIEAQLKQIFSQVDDELVMAELANMVKDSAASSHGAFSAIALGFIGKPQVIPHVTDALVKGGGLALLPSINQVALKEEVFEIIKYIGAPAVEPLLQKVYQRSKDPMFRDFIGDALNEIATQECIPLLLEHLDRECIEVREVVANTLKALDWQPENNQQKIVFLIATHSWDALVDICEPVVVEQLIMLLADNKYPNEVIKVLGQIGDQRAIIPILDHLKNANLFQRAKRENYANALMSIAKQHRDAVKIALKDDHKRIKKVAKLVLKEI